MLNTARQRAKILGSAVDVVDQDQCMKRIAAFMQESGSHHIITLNAEIVYQARNDNELLDIINRADLVTPDGIGVVWAGKRLGYAFNERVTGIDLLQRIGANAAEQGWSIYFLGAAPAVAERAAEKLCSQFPGLHVLGVRDGYFTAEQLPEIVADIQALSPDFLFVALGAPKQDFFIDQYRDQLGARVLIGVGGSFDVIAGDKKRAPKWMIRWHLEWLYRLLAEPQRWRRQLALPKFIWAVLRQRRTK